jgi:hypothetical protein
MSWRGAKVEKGTCSRLAGREATFGIDRDLSYLGLSWLNCRETPEQGAALVTMSYAEARSIWPNLTVDRFAFYLRMRDAFRVLPQLREGQR